MIFQSFGSLSLISAGGSNLLAASATLPYVERACNLAIVYSFYPGCVSCFEEFMRKLLRIVALSSWICSACLVFAERSDSSEADFLSFEQKVRIAQIIASRTPPVTNINFSIAVNESVLPGIQLESFPPEAEAIAPQLHEFGTLWLRN
jgi:hypothetical protein